MIKILPVYGKYLLLFGNTTIANEFRDYDISQRELLESSWTSSRKGLFILF